MKFIEIIKRSFDSSHVYSQQELIQIVQTLDLSLENVIPYITAPKHLEYGRNIIYHTKNLEVMVLYFPSLAKTPIHNHGTSTGCIYIVQGAYKISYTILNPPRLHQPIIKRNILRKEMYLLLIKIRFI
ncbi:hypothetical protein P4J09_30055 [Bacillus cereus]|nr:hypothetical protein [Bacillus cereus]